MTVFSSVDAHIDALVPEWLTLPEVAERLGLDITRIRPLIKEGQLLAVRRGENKALMVPADFIGDGAITKGLSGTLTELKQLLPPAQVEYVEKQPTLEEIFLSLTAKETR